MACRHMAVFLLLICDYVEAREREVTSWKKAGVSFQQYREESIECAKLGYFRDVSRDKPAERFLRGFRTADDALNQVDISGAASGAGRWRDTILRTQPDRQKKDLHTIQVKDVHDCLMDKGYSTFVLSSTEAGMLSKYPSGSPERHRYLHRLASR